MKARRGRPPSRAIINALVRLDGCPQCGAERGALYSRGWSDRAKTIQYLGCRKCRREFSERTGPWAGSHLPKDKVKEVLSLISNGTGLRETARVTKVTAKSIGRIRNRGLEHCRTERPWRKLTIEEGVKFWKGVLQEIAETNKPARSRLEALGAINPHEAADRQSWVGDVSSWVLGKTWKYRGVVERRALALLL